MQGDVSQVVIGALPNLITTVLSGIFAVIAATVPLYFQRNKSLDHIIDSYRKAEGGNNLFFTTPYICMLFLFWSLFISLLVYFGAAVGVEAASVKHEGLYVAIRNNEVLRLDIDAFVFYLLQNTYYFETLIVICTVGMIVPSFLIGKIAAQRAARYGLWVLLVGASIALAASILINKVTDSGERR